MTQIEQITPAASAARSEQVAPQLREHLVLTPLVKYDVFSEELGAEVLVKSEHLQRTGSFKARGSMAKILTLTDEQRERGVVTASTGNHGLGRRQRLGHAGWSRHRLPAGERVAEQGRGTAPARSRTTGRGQRFRRTGAEGPGVRR